MDMYMEVMAVIGYIVGSDTERNEDGERVLQMAEGLELHITNTPFEEKIELHLKFGLISVAIS